jgi:hypothetical protein
VACHLSAVQRDKLRAERVGALTGEKTGEVA